MAYFNGAQILNTQFTAIPNEWESVADIELDMENSGVTEILADIDKDISKYTEFRYYFAVPNYDAALTDVAIYCKLGEAVFFYTKNDMAENTTYTSMGTIQRVKINNYQTAFLSVHGHGRSETGTASRSNVVHEYTIVDNFNPSQIQITVTGKSGFVFRLGTRLIIEGRK